MKRKPEQKPAEPLVFTRADSAALARFDPSTKICSMNCGPHRLDPRTRKERMFLCPECYIARKVGPDRYGHLASARDFLAQVDSGRSIDPGRAVMILRSMVQAGEAWPEDLTNDDRLPCCMVAGQE